MDDADVLTFYERTADHVHRYASRLTGVDTNTTADLVQDVYLTLVRQVRAGRGSKGRDQGGLRQG